MRSTILYISALIVGILVISDIATARYINQPEALQIAKPYFLDKDVDYYIQPAKSAEDLLTGKEWTIFVDAEPTKGWEHISNGEIIDSVKFTK